MNADVGILTALFNAFVGVFATGAGRIMPEATRLLLMLGAIELTLAGIYWALRGDGLIVGLMQKILLIGGIGFIVTTWRVLINQVLNGFIWTGMTAGNMAPAAGIALMNDPSRIISQSMVVLQPISSHIDGLGLAQIGQLVLYGWAYIVTILAFFILAIQVFITYLEFYIVSTLALILVPFGVFKHTAFLAERAIGTVISFGIKLMVLSFIISVAGPVIQGIVIPVAPTLTNAYSVMLAALAIAFLAWNAPAIAAGMISGGPSLSAGSAAGFVASAGLGAVGLAGAGAAAGRASAAAGVGATRAASTAAGVVRTAAGLGAAAATVSGSSAAVGALSGIGRAAAGAVRDVAGAPMRAAGASLRQAYARGQVKAFAYTGGNAPGAVHARAAGAGVAASAGGQPRSQSIQSGVRAAQNLRSAIPPEAHASGGIHAPIKHE